MADCDALQISEFVKYQLSPVVEFESAFILLPFIIYDPDVVITLSHSGFVIKFFLYPERFKVKLQRTFVIPLVPGYVREVAVAAGYSLSVVDFLTNIQ